MEENNKKNIEEEKEELKEYYKNKSTENREDIIDNIIQKIKSFSVNKGKKDDRTKIQKIKSLLSYLYVLLTYLIIFFFIIFIADKWIMPSIVHDRQTVSVPDLMGMNINEAKNKLANHKLYQEIVSEQFSNKAEGIIIKQVPEPGKAVKSKRPIFLTVSKGKEEIITPDLVGINYRDARVRIYNSGLNLGEITFIYDEFIPQDTVISQSIKKGTKVSYSKNINLIVSKGSKSLISVPKLIGKNYAGIEEYLAKEDLKLGSVEFIEDETFVPGTIVSQIPNVGEKIKRGSYINIIITR